MNKFIISSLIMFASYNNCAAEAIGIIDPTFEPSSNFSIPSDEEKNIKPKAEENQTYDTDKLTSLMENAKRAMVKRDFRRAIQIYTAIVENDKNHEYKSALEYLGVAREKNQQYAHAKAEYEKYIRLYPNTVGEIRVKQRLVGLMTATMKPRERLYVRVKKSRLNQWQNYGSAFQFYRRDFSVQNSDQNSWLSSMAFSNFSYTARLKNRNYQVKNVVNMSHSLDLEDRETGKKIKITRLYSEFNNKRYKLKTRAGRQTQNSSGTFGRFDGVTMRYRYKSKTYVNFSSGFPVNFNSYDQVKTNSKFYSTNVEIESLIKDFDLNSYFILQLTDDLVDRRAAGLSFKRFMQYNSLYGSIDYDTYYRTINNVLFNGSSRFLKAHNIGLRLNYRRSPLISTSNALMGQQSDSLDELRDIKSEEEIIQLAKDRTAKYLSGTITWGYKINKQIELTQDINISRMTGTRSSDGIFATEDTGYEKYVSSQVLVNNIFYNNDISILTIRYADTAYAKRYSVSLQRRDIIKRSTRFSSRLRADFQQRDRSRRLYILRPSMKINHRVNKTVKIELEAGMDYRKSIATDFTTAEKNAFFGLGYIATF